MTARRWLQGECAPAASTEYAVLGIGGRVLAGWPQRIAGWGSDPVVRADGSMIVAASGGRTLAWSLAGRRLAGWPTRGVDVDSGCYAGSTPVATGAGGVVVLGSRNATLFGAAGAIRPGWPIRVPYTVAISCPGCTPGPAAPVLPVVGASGIYVGAYEGRAASSDPGRPRVVVLDRAGRRPAGAQRVIGAAGDEIGWLSIAPDGRVWAVVGISQQDGIESTLVLVAQDQPIGG